MILKKLKRTNFEKPKATMIAALVDYIFAEKDEYGNDKLMYSGALNFITGTLAAQKNEMIALAEESVQSKMPIAHWVMSWQENELPSHEQIDEAAHIFLERMGLQEHQAFYTLHGNTGNYHVHIAVNRTNPYTMKTVQPHRGFDIKEGHRIAALITHKQGWASQEKARYRVNEKGEIVRNIKQIPFLEMPQTVKPTAKAEDFENATGEKSAMRIAQERGHKIIKTAGSWKELHEKLAAVGLRFEKKGSGAIVFVGETAVKASSIDRNFGLSRLCKRLGEYKAGVYPPEAEDMPKIEPEPVSEVFIEQWREYRQARADEAERRRSGRKRVAADRRRIRERQREQRRKSLAALAPHGLPMLNIARHFLKEQQREERERLREETPKPTPLGSFKYWLGRKSNRLANLWRFRKRIRPDMEVRKFEFPKIGSLAAPYRACLEILQKENPGAIDASRMDSLLALHMRLAGYTPQETANEMYRQARPLRREKENRDWIDYARRMVWYAFGAPGDIDLAAAKPTKELIQTFQREAERIEAERQKPKPPEEQPQYRMRMR